MKMEKFSVKVQQYNNIEAYTLSVTYNGWQWSSLPVNNAHQMREIAKVLLGKAKELENETHNK